MREGPGGEATPVATPATPDGAAVEGALEEGQSQGRSDLGVISAQPIEIWRGVKKSEVKNGGGGVYYTALCTAHDAPITSCKQAVSCSCKLGVQGRQPGCYVRSIILLAICIY